MAITRDNQGYSTKALAERYFLRALTCKTLTRTIAPLQSTIFLEITWTRRSTRITSPPVKSIWLTTFSWKIKEKQRVELWCTQTSTLQSQGQTNTQTTPQKMVKIYLHLHRGLTSNFQVQPLLVEVFFKDLRWFLAERLKLKLLWRTLKARLQAMIIRLSPK